MRFRSITKTVLVAALCASIAAAAGIASGAAQTKKTRKTTNSSAPAGHPGGPLIMFGGGPVHADVVVLNKAGTAWITVTQDNGKVSSVSGDQLVITEGTDKVPYKTVTLTIPADAKIIRNGKTAALSDFVAGDQVHVSQSSEETIVIGGDKVPAGPPMGGPGLRFKGHGPHGGGPGAPPFGPPPVAGASGSGSSDSGSSDSTTS